MGSEITSLVNRVKELEMENAMLKIQAIEITKAKELYLKIFEDFPALIWRSRLDKLCDYFNKTWLDFTGRTMEQEFGNGWAEGVHPDDFDFCLETYVNAFDKREAFVMEYRMKNKYGEYRWIRDFGRPFYDLDDAFLGYIGSCYDITEIKENESKLIELNAAKNKFFSIISHDLISPFNSIMGFSELLVKEVNENKNISKFADAILKSSERIMTLLTNLLTWAQSESGRIVFSPKKLDLYHNVNEVSQLINIVADKKSVVIENRIKENTFIFADNDMINTVLRNLISNSIKFSNNGDKVVISAENTPDDMVIVKVVDNGEGIPQERIEKLFTLSENKSTLGTNREKGTGLGLIICKEFIQKNNGQLWIESVVGSGTTISFSVPKS